MSRPSCAPKTREEHERIGRLHVPANLRGRLIGTIERADIARLHHEMSDRPHQANRTIALLSKAFAWAEKHGLRPNGVNPSRFIDKYSEAKRERFLSPQELARLGSYWTNGRTRTQSPRSACYCSQEPGAPSPYRQMGRGRP